MQARALEVCKNAVRNFLTIVFVFTLMPGDAFLIALPQEKKASQQEAEKLSPEQLDSLVAPIALYPDELLSQTLVASTYPLEIIQLQQWLEKNKGLKDKALTEAVQKQDWDPSIQAMASLPDVVKQLAENIKWTTDLGNAFLAQQSDVMEAVQRMRKKAKDSGNLKSNEQQKVETKVVESKTVVVVEQANPQVVYVPSYNPTVVYGVPAYPYPAIAYPPPGYYAAGMAISFGVGVAMGAAWGGGWGWGCGWGHNDVNVNVNNNYVRNYNRQNANAQIGNRTGRGNTAWQHNSRHRGGTPYSNQRVANQYGGTARGDSLSARQSNARQTQARQPGATRQAGGTSGAIGSSAGGVNRAAERQAGGTDRAANRSSSGGSFGGGDRVGDRSVPNTPSARNTSAFSGGASGMSGSGARASSARGASSMGGRARGGGGRRR
jgi:Protein of unknown function (DUF3300)